MKVEIVHHVTGRIRLRVPELAECVDVLAWIKGPLLSDLGILSFRVNRWCASVVIVYDHALPGTVECLLAAIEVFTVPVLQEEAASDTGIVAAGGDAKIGLAAAVGFLGKSHSLLWSSIAIAGSLFGGAFAFVTVPLVCVTALPSVMRAWTILRSEHRLNVDFLDSLAVLVSVGRGQFLTASFITWMVSLGDWIRDKTAGESKRVISKLLEFEYSTAWVLREGKVLRVPAIQIELDETVIVYPGEIIPVDGVITKGRATVDQKSITGESLPIERTIEDQVFAATVLREGKLSIRATRVGASTTAAQIVSVVEAAPVGETRTQNYAEQFGDQLVAPMLALSAALYAGTGNMDRLLSMLIVDFGTGMRVAAPTAVLSSIAHAATEGILIKSGRKMERLAEVDTIVFDKTGTLTHGSPEISEILSYDKRMFPARKILGLAAAAEARLKHPVSDALVTKAIAEGIEIPERHGSEFEIGMGVEARVNGYCVHVGSERFFSQKRIEFAKQNSFTEAAKQKGYSTLLFAIDGVLKGVIPYADRVRGESKNVIASLHQAGIENVLMISGDNRVTANAVAKQLGIDQCFAEALPADKAEIVKGLQQRGHVVAMVGDGINDSPALAYADVGIAMKHGADVAKETADVLLIEDNLWRLVLAIEISRGAMARIKQNYGIIAGLNALALLLTIPSGLLSPNMAATLSNGSAILASLNSVRKSTAG